MILEMNRLIRKILKEELQGQEFIDHHYSELDRLESMKEQIIDYLHSEFPNLVEVETRIKKVQLGSMKLGMENPVVEVMVFTLKFKDLTSQEITKNKLIKTDIINIFTNYFGFDVLEYGSPIDIEFKAQAWVNF
jgi:GTPase Era involved in 16S rRNA processing